MLSAQEKVAIVRGLNAGRRTKEIAETLGVHLQEVVDYKESIGKRELTGKRYHPMKV